MQFSKNSSVFVLAPELKSVTTIDIKPSSQSTDKLWIYCCLNWRTRIFADYINSLNIADIIVSYNDISQLKRVDYNATCNYIIPFLIDDAYHCKFLPSNTIFINTEPVDTNNKCENIEKVRALGYKIIDYSPINAKIYNSLYIPYQIRPEENEKLKKLLKETPKERDVVTVAYMVPRRTQIQIEGYNKDLDIANITGYDEQRDKDIAEGKILLNIHQRDYSVFEHIRCDRWIYAGMTIVSEESRETSDLDIAPFVHFVPYSKCIDKCVELLKGEIKIEERIIPENRRMSDIPQQIQNLLNN